jgi:TolB-like protein
MNVTSRLFQAQDQDQTPVPRPTSDMWTHDEVRDELNRIVNSRLFIKSIRLSCFLSTAVDYLLAGKADCFKEYTVGTEVYKRPASYDPTLDTIVRTEARRLRTKLREYYSDFPEQHRVRITLASGSYVPVIEVGYPSPFDDQFGTRDRTTLLFNDKSVSVAVFSFNANAIEPTVQHVANNLEEELTHELAQTHNVKVFRACLGGLQTPVDQLSHWSRSGIQFALRGHVHLAPDGPVAQIQLSTMRGMILWSARFSGESLQGKSNEIASTVCNSFLSSTSPDNRSGARASTLEN